MKVTLICAGVAAVALATRAAPLEEESPRPEVDDPSYVVLYSVAEGMLTLADRVNRSEEAWKEILTPLQFEVLRKKGTEKAYTGALLKNDEEGTYTCAACGADLFTSDTKFDSGTGWPSFYAPVARENVATEVDTSYGVRRIEILCRRCGGHLGHVFDDGPPPTGLRFCVNSASLRFEKRRESSPSDRDASDTPGAEPLGAPDER